MEEKDKADWLRYCQGDLQGLEHIYDRHGDSMFSYCMYVTGDRQLSEDIVQNTFVKLMEQRSRLRIKVALENWLFVSTRNLLYDHLKKRENQTLPLTQISDPAVEMNIEARLFIESVLDKLTHTDRELIILRERERFSIRDIADMVNISEEAVRVRLYRIRKKMQQIAGQRT